MWLLECPNKEVVDRVVALNSCQYGATRIFFDRWMAGAGRSGVLQKMEVTWVLIQGIPLHLRSLELFQSLGDKCGGFLDYDVSLCPISSVRIKVKEVGGIPEEVSIRFQSEVFPVRVIKESMGFEPRVRGVKILRIGEKKDKEVQVLPMEEWRVKPTSKSGAGREVGESSNSGSGGRRCHLEKSKSESVSTVGRGALSVWSPVDKRQGVEEVQDGNPEVGSLPEGFYEEGMGMELLRSAHDLSAVSKQGIDRGSRQKGNGQFGVYSGLRLHEGLGLSVVVNGISVSLESSLQGSFSFSFFPSVGLSQRCKVCVGGPVNGAQLERSWTWFGGPSAQAVGVPLDGAVELDLRQGEPRGALIGVGDDIMSSVEDGILDMVDKVAKAIDLRNTSVEMEVSESVRKSASKVLARRKSARGKTKMERELAKLGSSLEFAIVAQPRERRSGMNSSPIFYYEF
ncbi:hypothetical protein LINPERHAP2_LOCUS20511 [Linum perenne]